jgi:hypothetical protein
MPTFSVPSLQCLAEDVDATFWRKSGFQNQSAAILCLNEPHYDIFLTLVLDLSQIAGIPDGDSPDAVLTTTEAPEAILPHVGRLRTVLHNAGMFSIRRMRIDVAKTHFKDSSLTYFPTCFALQLLRIYMPPDEAEAFASQMKPDDFDCQTFCHKLHLDPAVQKPEADRYYRWADQVFQALKSKKRLKADLQAMSAQQAVAATLSVARKMQELSDSRPLLATTTEVHWLVTQPRPSTRHQPHLAERQEECPRHDSPDP